MGSSYKFPFYMQDINWKTIPKPFRPLRYSRVAYQ